MRLHTLTNFLLLALVAYRKQCADASMMPMTCRRAVQVLMWSVFTVSKRGEDDAHALYEYGAMPHTRVESESLAYFSGRRSARYAI